MSLGLALWILVAPAADWSWTILDGPFDSAVRCEARREARLDADHTLCARLPVMRPAHTNPSAAHRSGPRGSLMDLLGGRRPQAGEAVAPCGQPRRGIARPLGPPD
jgi:hypothetical protein